MKHWGFTVATVLLLALWLASGFPGVRWHWPDVEEQSVAGRGLSKGRPYTHERPEERTLWTATVHRGCLWLARYHSTAPEMDFELELLLASLKEGSGRWLAWPDWGRTTQMASTYKWTAFHIFIPLWIPPLLVGSLAGILWHRRFRQHRRRRRGECLRCGYALAGLPVDETGGKPTCPECGT